LEYRNKKMNVNNLHKQYKKNGYVIIKNFYDKTFCKTLDTYCKLRFQNLKAFMEDDRIEYRESTDGTLDDGDVLGAGSFYADPFTEAMLINNKDFIKKVSKKDIEATYSYWRYYRPGNELEYHTDRNDCIVSATICVGYDVSNVDKDYNWKIFMRSKEKDIGIEMHPGDMVIYNGLDLPHWREKFKGRYQSQVFIHYSDIPIIKDLKDGRNRLGLPLCFKKKITR